MARTCTGVLTEAILSLLPTLPALSIRVGGGQITFYFRCSTKSLTSEPARETTVQSVCHVR